MSRLFNHFQNLLPGTSGSPQSQVASALYVTSVASGKPDLAEFTGEWWDAIEDETKAGILCMVAAGVLKEALKHLLPEDAVIASLRAATSLTPEDQRDINA